MPETPKLSYLEDLVRRYDKDRFLAALFAPAEMRARIMTLLAFNAEVARIRETVSEPLIGQMRLQWWRDVVLALAEGTGPPHGHPVAEAMAQLFTDRALEASHFLDLLGARELDMTDEPPADFAALIRYAHATSSQLNILMLNGLGIHDPAANTAGVDAGIAWALTGILRATPQLAAGNRSMLPAQELAEAGLAVQDLQSPDCIVKLRPIAERLSDEIKDRINAAREARSIVERSAVPVLLPVTLADSYLKTLGRVGFNIYHPKFALARPAVARMWWNNWRGVY
jgi:NADH dehydrogenase [ubiquinone] 1 alpha subcomplex assembly factor 6